MEALTELYGPAERERLERKRKRVTAAVLALAAAALLGCVLLCLLTDTANAGRMELRAVAVSTLGGWGVIFLWRRVLRPLGHELRHARMLAAGERQRITGLVTVEPETLQIRGSIRFRPVRVETEQGRQRLKVCAGRAAVLERQAGRRLTLEAANGYVAAYGEAAP